MKCYLVTLSGDGDWWIDSRYVIDDCTGPVRGSDITSAAYFVPVVSVSKTTRESQRWLYHGPAQTHATSHNWYQR